MQFKWRTSINPAFRKRSLFKASTVSGLAIFLLAIAGSMMPLQLLSEWGFLMLLICGTLITWSMLPYRKLERLESNPDYLWTNSKGDLVYGKQDLPILTIPLQSIDTSFFIDKKNIYGIGIVLHSHPQEKIRIHQVSFNFKTLQTSSLRKYGCDIFLPYFSERSFNELLIYTERDSIYQRPV